MDGMILTVISFDFNEKERNTYGDFSRQHIL